MKRIILLATLLIGSASANAETAGSAITLTEETPLQRIIDHFPDYQGKEVRCLVQVEKVCQKKGCWMKIRQGDVQMLVTFKDYGFFVPKELADREVTLQGQVIRQQVSVKEQRHYLRDEGRSAQEIEQVTESKLTFRFVASGVAY